MSHLITDETPVVDNRKPKRCKRPSTRQGAKEAHALKMILKKIERQRITVGFTAVPNKRVDGAIAAALSIGVSLGMDPPEAYAQACREVAAKLPRARMVFDWANKGAVKNDNPEYRK